MDTNVSNSTTFANGMHSSTINSTIGASRNASYNDSSSSSSTSRSERDIFDSACCRSQNAREARLTNTTSVDDDDASPRLSLSMSPFSVDVANKPFRSIHALALANSFFFFFFFFFLLPFLSAFSPSSSSSKSPLVAKATTWLFKRNGSATNAPPLSSSPSSSSSSLPLPPLDVKDILPNGLTMLMRAGVDVLLFASSSFGFQVLRVFFSSKSSSLSSSFSSFSSLLLLAKEEEEEEKFRSSFSSSSSKGFEGPLPIIRIIRIIFFLDYKFQSVVFFFFLLSFD